MLRSDKQLINQLFHYAIIIVVINGYYLHSKLFDCDLSNTNWRTDTARARCFVMTSLYVCGAEGPMWGVHILAQLEGAQMIAWGFFTVGAT